MEQDEGSYQTVVGVFESESYTISKSLYPNPQLIEDAEYYYKNLLARNPYYGHEVEFAKQLYYFDTTPFYPRVPLFRILYRFSLDYDPNNVELLAIIPIDGSADNED